MICAAWIRLDDGGVARCDRDCDHLTRERIPRARFDPDEHFDSIIGVSWRDNDPRMLANLPAKTPQEIRVRISRKRFEMACLWDQMDAI